MKKKAIITFTYFLLCTGLIGAVFALINQLTRHYGIESQALSYILAVVMAYCMYRLWRWLYHRLDEIEKKK